MILKEYKESELPREKLLREGVDNLSNAELLGIILRTGTKNISVLELANRLLKKYEGLTNLSQASISEISLEKGIGQVKAITLISAFELGKRASAKEITLNMVLNNAQKVHDVFKTSFLKINHEELMVVTLNTKKELISYKVIFKGTLDKSIVHPREIFKYAIRENAKSIIVIHNHPSGNILPSQEDIKITKKLKEAGFLLGIPLSDHLITNGKEYYSFYEQSLKT